VAIFAAAVVAGMMNSIAGGGTILTFPTLLWMGRDPIMANATSTVALWPGSLGAMYGFRRELEGSRRWMIRLGAPSLAGGLLGAILLLQTPSRVFASLVPFLILFATILFAAQEPIMRALGKADVTIEERPDTEPSRGWWVWAAIFQFLSSVYGGYFGAGNGIVMLAVLGLLGLTDIHRMNGLKNFFAVCINVVASAYFIISGAINWPDAIVMTVGAIVGGYGGAGLARKLGRRAVRRAVVVIGIFITLSLLFRR
jgi:uncharacterized membrane protein YfcA